MIEEVALYRKYRPHKFKDVIGQEHVISVLRGSIEQSNISHAYLFAGSRGTGKTSVARIFAKEVGTTVNDLYEIDAASNRGIDDVREIRESVNTLPFESKYKVYIIDEVHMLTKEAFNALLKTLEEPPSHVIFILATTDLDKVLDTVISRCQTFTFKKPSQEVLKDVVLSVAKKEGFSLEQSSADLIALLGDGSFRDTLGILQKVISSSKDKKVSIEEVEKVTGAPRSALVEDFISGIVLKDANKSFTAIRTAKDGNVDIKVFAKLVLRLVRFAMLLRFAGDMKKYIEGEVSEANFVFITKIAGDKRVVLSSGVLLELILAYDLIGRSYIPELPLELAVIKLVGQDV